MKELDWWSCVIQAINRCFALVVNETVWVFYGDFYGLFLFIALILRNSIILQVCFRIPFKMALLLLKRSILSGVTMAKKVAYFIE